jgi:hypothetical protein
MEPEDDIDATGALSAALAADRKNRQLVEQQIRSNMEMLTQARDSLREQRVGPSTSERLFAISAALGRPTRTGRFSESMANLGEVLGGQEKSKREAMSAREAMIEKYGMDIGESQLSMLQSQLAGSGQMVNRALAAAKAPALGETERMIQRALALPEGSPERKMLLAAIRGTPENIAAAVSRAEGIQGTKPPPSSKAGNPKYKRGSDGKLYKWSPE